MKKSCHYDIKRHTVKYTDAIYKKQMSKWEVLSHGVWYKAPIKIIAIMRCKDIVSR